jgi:hypothetical protein
MGFAYCDFTRRVNVAGVSRRPQASEPVPLEAAAVVAHDGD